MKKKKLLIFSYDFPPSDGGISRLCNEIAHKAIDEFDDVTVLTRRKVEAQKSSFNQKIKIRFVHKRRVLSELTSLWFLLTLKNKNNYQVLCGVWHPEAFLVWLAGYKKINVLVHGAEMLTGASKFRKFFWLPIYANWLLNKVTIIANSDYTGSLCEIIVSKKHVNVLPLGVNHQFFKPFKKTNTNKVIIGTVSRIEKFKGHDFILKVISKLPNKYLKKIEWHIAGTGPYLNQLKKNVTTLNLDEIVKFHGFVPDDELPSFYNFLDLFILCTREIEDEVEGFGLVFLEAQSCGVPVIGTNTGGISSAIENKKGGWLIEQDNEQELSNLITLLVENNSILKVEGIKARHRVEKECTWELYSQKLFKILK